MLESVCSAPLAEKFHRISKPLDRKCRAQKLANKGKSCVIRVIHGIHEEKNAVNKSDQYTMR